MDEKTGVGVSKSLDNSDLVEKRLRIRPRVWAYELAGELRVSASVLSNFETGRRERLPDGRGRSEYLEALGRIVARREAGEWVAS